MIIQFTPFPMLETQRLMLRTMTLSDAEAIFEMRRNPQMHLYTDTAVDDSIEVTKAYIDKMNQGVDTDKWLIWAIEEKSTEQVIGTICIWNLDAEKNTAELGYGLNPKYQGKGYMQEALQCVVDYGLKTMQLTVLEAYTEAENAASSKLLIKCGFTKTGEVDDQGYLNERVYHMHIYQRS